MFTKQVVYAKKKSSQCNSSAVLGFEAPKMEENICPRLPSEILSMIFQYLDEKDISRCSQVCVQWREEINRNDVWKNLCLRRGWAEVLDQPEMWGDTPSRVEPRFKAPPLGDNSSLSPLCVWHLDFLQCAHLYNNWETGQYVIQKFETPVSQHLGDVQITSMDLNRMLVVLGDDNGVVSVWKQEEKGPKFVQQVQCSFHAAVVSEIFLEGTSFVVLQLGLLQVFHKDDNGVYKLCYCKAMIPHEVELPSMWPSDGCANSWFIENVYDVFDEDKFRFARALQDPIVAFWGTVKDVQVLALKPGEQLRELKLPYPDCSISDVALSLKGSLLYIAVYSEHCGDVILEYDLEKDCCTKKMKESSNIMRLHVNYNFLVTVNRQGVFSIWDCQRGIKHVALSCLGVSFQETSLGLFGDSILYQSGNKIGSVLNCTGNIQYNEFEVIPSTKFLTKAMGELFVLQNGTDIEVWSWKKKTMLYRIKDLLVNGDWYAAWCNDACIVLWGFYTAPIFIWFW